MNPFHPAYFVRDLRSTRDSYGGLLGYFEGRSTETCVDFDSFGHAFSFHLGPRVEDAQTQFKVDNKSVLMPRFGCVPDWEAFDWIEARLRAAGTAFVIGPMIGFAGRPGEQATVFFRDPSGNPLEFKTRTNPEALFAK